MLRPDPKLLIITVVFMVLAGMCQRIEAFDDGQDANDLLGQLDPSDQPVYTKYGANNGPNNRGFNGPYDVAIDTTTHRLFVVDYNNNRVVVYNLDSSNNLIDRVQDNVLGQPDFSSRSSATTQSGMYSPRGVCYDSSNSRLFVADYANHRVTVFDVSSITDGEDAINVLGQSDFTSNTSATTQSGMYSPSGVCYDDSNSRLFVADGANNRVTVFDVSSITDGEDAVNVLGQSDFTSSTSATTQSGMYYPYGVCYDSSNTRLFVAENNNHRVIVFNVSSITDGEDAINVLGQSDFTSSTYATTQSGMYYPRGVCYDSSNTRLFVADYENRRVTVFDVSSVTDGEDAINVLGQSDFTSNTSATTQSGMNYPYGVCYDSSNTRLFVADSSNQRVTVFDVSSITDGEDASDCLGQLDASDQPLYTKNGAHNGPNNRGFNGPYDVAIDTTTHRLFVVDYNNNRVVVYNLDSSNNLIDRVQDNVLGQPDFSSRSSATTQSGMYSPRGVCYDSSNSRLFVADYANHRVTVFDVSSITDGEDAINVLGQSDFTSNTSATTQSGMYSPSGVCYDSSNSRLLVADTYNIRVTVFDVSSITDGEDAINVLGQSDFTSNSYATTQSGMYYPYGVCYDSSNSRLFVADTYNHRVTVFDVSSITDGEDAINVLGQSDFTSGSGATTQSGMYYPYGVCYDSSNSRLFVADTYNIRVTVFDVSSITDGEDAINVLGQSDFTSNTSAITQSGMYDPRGVCYDDSNSRLFVADTSIHRVSIFSENTPPGVPSSLSQKRSDTEETISWGAFTRNTTPKLGFTLSDPDTDDQVKYNIQVSSYSDFSYLKINSTSSLMSQGTVEYTCSVLEDTTWYWKVKCIDEWGFASSYVTANSGGIAFVVDTTSTEDTTDPAGISDLTALTASNIGEITLKWTAPGDDDMSGTVLGYLVKYSSTSIITNSGFDDAVTYEQNWDSFVSGGTDETRTATGLVEGVWYWFAIKGYDDWSNYGVWNSSADVPGVNTECYARAGYEAPNAIPNLSALTGSAAGEIDITWTAPGKDGTTGNNTVDAYYTLKYATYSITDLGGDTTAWWNVASTYFQSWNVKNYGQNENKTLTLTPGTTYYFAIKTTDDAGITSLIDTNASSGSQAWALSGEFPLIVKVHATEGKAGDDITGEPVSEILTNEGNGTPPTVNGNYTDSYYTVDNADETYMHLDKFDISGIPRTTYDITAAVLRVDYITEAGYDEGNPLECSDDEGSFYNNTITIAEHTSDFTTTYDLYNDANFDIEKATDVENLHFQLTNTGGGGGDCISFDYLWIEIEWADNTKPNAITTLSALTGDNNGEIKLTWTAPGDDGTQYDNLAGSYYRVRYDTYAVQGGDTTTWWNNADTYSQNWPVAARETMEEKTLAGFTPGDTYWFAIKTTDAENNTSSIDDNALSDSTQANAQAKTTGDTTPPAAITNLSALTGSNEGEVELSWSAPGDDEWDDPISGGKYGVKWSTYSSFDWGEADNFDLQWTTSTSPGNSESKVITGLIGGTTYYFRIWTADEVPNWSSGLSNGATAMAKMVVGANRYWVGENNPDNWNDPNNWSATSGGTGNAGVPGTNDTAIFDGGNTYSCQIDISSTVASVIIYSTYTATISINSGESLTTSGSFEIAGGTFTTNGEILDVGSYAQTGGIFNAGGSTITCNGDFSITIGTFNTGASVLVLDGTDGDATFTGDGYTFNNVIFQSTSTAVRIWTLGGGTITFNGDFQLKAQDSGDLTVTAVTNNPDLNILGSVDYTGTGAGIESISMGEGTWTVGGNVDFSDGTVDASTSTFVLNGSSTQTLTMDGNSLNILQITKPSSDGVYFADNLTLSTFTATTADTSLYFRGGSTFTFTNINFDGQSESSPIVLRSTSTNTAWYLTVTGTQSVSYVDVRDSDASGGNTILAIDGTSVNSGNNVKWDFGPPAAITDLTGLCDSDTGDVTLSWSTPGDDEWTGTLPSGSEYRIDYSTYSIQWSTTTYDVEISTSGVAPHTQVSYTITGLTGGTTWYFQIWTRDEVPTNWSGLSNGATVWVNPILSVSISTDTYNFGELNASTSAVSTANITVTNDGNVTETYSIKCSSTTKWTPNNTPGNDEFTLQSAFHPSEPDNDDISWKTDDILTESLQQCTTAAFSIDNSQNENGKNVPPFESNIKHFWLRIKTPLSTSTTTQQGIKVTISAEQGSP